MILSVQLLLPENKFITISQESKNAESISFNKSIFLPVRISGKTFCCKMEYADYSDDTSDGKKSPFEIKESDDGFYTLRLKETFRYICKSSCGEDNFSITNQEANKFLKYSYIGNEYYSFSFINYLGLAHLKIGTDTELPFEVVPAKMNYEEDYIALTESLAKKCSELMLDYSGVTYSSFSQKQDSESSLLEQFIFLRQFCYSDNIESLFESIKRNPDRLLVQEEILKPFGQGAPSSKFYSNPFSYSRNWNQVYESDSYLPSEISVTQKCDSLNTPANSFIKFAFTYFYEICRKLADQLDSSSNANNRQTECYIEAKKICCHLETILQDSFFDDVSDLDIMPDNNQVLQKREGYAQIFNAFTMINMALQLDWKGKDSVYNGEAKNTALLYEYWLFFELYNIINSIQKTQLSEYESKEQAKYSGNAFCISKDDGLIISLKEGEKSCQHFDLNKYNTKINLYYNRTFSPKEFSTTSYEGSYSRPFRPDYTLAVFSSDFENENDAVKYGEVSYIHFDAKYRITDLTAFINKDESTEEEIEEIDQEKLDSITNTYKRGDLLKMHTYNDAIRRTIGSYVLYPGDESTKPFCLYEEILPGVGAFAIRPSIKKSSENELKSFIEQLIEAKSMNCSRLNRMHYFTNTILQEPSVKNKAAVKKQRSKTQRKTLCVLGYIRNDGNSDYFSFLKNNGSLQVGKKFFFYYYAIKDGFVYSHHKDISKAKYFKFYTNRIRETNTYEIEPYLCKIENSFLVSKEDLTKKLKEIGYSTDVNNHSADFYYLVEVKVTELIKSQSVAMQYIDSINGNDTFSTHSPKVISL